MFNFVLKEILYGSIALKVCLLGTEPPIKYILPAKSCKVKTYIVTFLFHTSFENA